MRAHKGDFRTAKAAVNAKRLATNPNISPELNNNLFNVGTK